MRVPMLLAGYNDDYQQDLNQELLDNLSDDGFVIPSLTVTEITTIAPVMPNGTFWYDETNDEIKVKKAGTVRTVTTS